MHQTIWATDKDDRPMLKEFWKNYIFHAFNNNGDTWNEIKDYLKWHLVEICPEQLDMYNVQEVLDNSTAETVNLMTDLNLEVSLKMKI